MRVKDLIKALLGMPQDAKVFTINDLGIAEVEEIRSHKIRKNTTSKHYKEPYDELSFDGSGYNGVIIE